MSVAGPTVASSCNKTNPEDTGWPLHDIVITNIVLCTAYTRVVLCCVYHTTGRSNSGRLLPDSRAIVLQPCGQCRRVNPGVNPK